MATTDLRRGDDGDSESSSALDLMDEDLSAIMPARRTDTLSSKPASESNTDTCRICRSEGSPDEPLFYPCKCSGSIKFVHQDCLMEWLAHSHKKHCELCKTPFHFTKLYDANMPQTLPWHVFIKTAVIHTAKTLVSACRGIIVGTVWMVILPWLVRWAWRWMFWMADAGWAREAFMHKTKWNATRGGHSKNGITSAYASVFQQFLGADNWQNHTLAEPLALTVAKDVFNRLGLNSSILSTFSVNDTVSSPASMSWPQADDSVLSSWTYLSELTPNPAFNRVLLDIFEGQLITCVVITGFILVFLIREWVVQQQPLVNLDHPNIVEQQFRQAAERMQADNDLLMQQQELIDRARQRLAELQDTAAALEQIMPTTFKGWDHLEASFDQANELLKNDNQHDFLYQASLITEQRNAARRAGVDLDEFNVRMNNKLASFSEQERHQWELVLLAGLDRADPRAGGRAPASNLDLGPSHQQAQDDPDSAEARLVRLRMTSGQTSSPATEVKRLLDEVEARRKDYQRSTSPQDPAGNAQRESSVDVTQSGVEDDEMPITNAGPDAKINIQVLGQGKLRPLPPPLDEAPLLTAKELEDKKVTDEALKSLEKEIEREDDELAEQRATSEVLAQMRATSPQMEGYAQIGAIPQAEESDDTSASDTTPELVEISGEEEELLPHDSESGYLDEASLEAADRPDIEQDSSSEQARPEVPAAPPTYHRRLAEWFWGDIQPGQELEIVPPPDEERIAGNNVHNEAPFVPVDAGELVFDAVAAPVAAPLQDRDPEVLAAAAQAGVDADAIEDAEDLEGILELLGLQGPFLGLIQTSTFCTVLVIGTVFGAVGLPYVWGKVVLSFIGDPIYFVFKLPLQVSSFIADFIIDVALVVTGWAFIVLTLAGDFLLSALEAWLPNLGGTKIMEGIMELACKTAESSSMRLQNIFLSSEPSDAVGWNWAFLGASVHAHASLKNLGGEVNAVLNAVGATITAIVETISSGSVSIVWQRTLNACTRIPEIPARLIAGVDVQQYMKPFMNLLSGLRSGALTFTLPESSLDPSLVYWSSTDRSLAVMTGYLALAALAAVYVALDTPITRSESGQKTEKMIRDTLRQAGGVFKVILIISIEMLVFPFYCGVLLDIAFLPLFQDVSVATRWAFATEYPYLFSFMHWFVATCYMFHFALFVGMCRKILRKGVLWFIRDPDDPTFHPVRDVLERNVTTQLRKIAFSALVYGALVILCLGGVIWTIGRLFPGIFPIHWVSTEPVIEFPADLLLYNAVTPFLVRSFRPSDAVNTLYAWWLRRCARLLRLSHFLFDDRRKDEEGRQTHTSWLNLLVSQAQISQEKQCMSVTAESSSPDAALDESFRRDGKYVLTPCNDQYRPPKPGEAFLRFDEPSNGDSGDVFVVDKDGKKNDHFAKVYIPPHFRVRVTIFMVCLWMFSVFMGLGSTLVPLVFGRRVLSSFHVVAQAGRMNDIYAYSIGAYLLAGALAVMFQGHKLLQKAREQASTVDITGFLAHTAELTQRYALQALKCMYVYGFVGLVLPMLFALFLQFYLVIPLHTYVAFSATTTDISHTSANSTLLAVNSTSPLSASESAESTFTLAGHSIHILQDYCLGLLYVRIFARILSSPSYIRIAEARRRIFAKGYLDPDVRLASRFFVAPTLLCAAVLLLGPPTLAAFIPPSLLGINKAKMYRYSFPVAAMGAVAVLLFRLLARLTSKWRARIRDEVYLVGERLHNLGERKPPVGSRTVVRRER